MWSSYFLGSLIWKWLGVNECIKLGLGKMYQVWIDADEISESRFVSQVLQIHSVSEHESWHRYIGSVQITASLRTKYVVENLVLSSSVHEIREECPTRKETRMFQWILRSWRKLNEGMRKITIHIFFLPVSWSVFEMLKTLKQDLEAFYLASVPGPVFRYLSQLSIISSPLPSLFSSRQSSSILEELWRASVKWPSFSMHIRMWPKGENGRCPGDPGSSSKNGSKGCSYLTETESATGQKGNHRQCGYLIKYAV